MFIISKMILQEQGLLLFGIIFAMFRSVMKFFVGIYTLFALLLNSPQDIPYNDIENAFLKNNSDVVARMGNDKLMISIYGKESVCSNKQAALVLKDFFTKNPVSNFKFIFKGKENQEGSFAIASYESKQDKFRFTFHFSKQESTYKIIRINIEKE